jgi:hypothetical protein
MLIFVLAIIFFWRRELNLRSFDDFLRSSCVDLGEGIHRSLEEAISSVFLNVSLDLLLQLLFIVLLRAAAADAHSLRT